MRLDEEANRIDKMQSYAWKERACASGDARDLKNFEIGSKIV